MNSYQVHRQASRSETIVSSVTGTIVTSGPIWRLVMLAAPTDPVHR